jgi:hypothetical protein
MQMQPRVHAIHRPPRDLNGQLHSCLRVKPRSDAVEQDRTRPSSVCSHVPHHTRATDWTRRQKMTGCSPTWSPVTSNKHPERDFSDLTCPIEADRTQVESGPLQLLRATPRQRDQTHPLRIWSLTWTRVWSHVQARPSLHATDRTQAPSPVTARAASGHYEMPFPLLKLHHPCSDVPTTKCITIFHKNFQGC